MITIKCPCGKNISIFQSRIGRKKYCSKKCFYRYRKRPKGLKYEIIVQNKAWFRRGQKPWITGKHHTVITKNNLRMNHLGKHFSRETEFKSNDVLGEKNNKWRGKDVGYFGLHTWIQRKYGKANHCENKENNILDFECSKKSNRYDWALIKGKRYERKQENFIMLCHSCHLKYDKEKSKKNMD